MNTTVDDLPPEKIIDVLQEVDKNIVKLTEFVQSLRLVQNKLNSVSISQSIIDINLGFCYNCTNLRTAPRVNFSQTISDA